MSSFGPWASPPPCNASTQCLELLQATSTARVGNAICYQELRPAGLQLEEAMGGCACETGYALGGLDCNELTTASPSAIACEMVVACICTVVVVRYAITLFGICYHRKIWKLNAAGTSYFIAWLALISVWCHSWTMVVLVFNFNPGAQRSVRTLNRVQIILLSIAVLNLVAAFIEMSSSVRLIQNIEKSRVPVAITIVIASLLIISTFLLAKPLVSAAIGFVVVLGLAVIGIVGPIIMYVRASNRMALMEGGKALTKWEIFTAVLGEVMLSNSQMKRLLGFTKSESSNFSKSSKDSQGAHVEPMTPSSKHSSKKDVKSLETALTHVQKREAKMISFLSRAVTMGVWLCGSLLAFLIAVGFNIIYDERFDPNPDYRAIRVADLFESLSFISALYQVLWFLNSGYQKALSAKRRRTSRYRTDSKEIAPSKDDSKLDESRLNVVGTYNSKDSDKVAIVTVVGSTNIA